MKTRSELEAELSHLEAEYRRVESILSMMEKGTRREDLARLKREQLEPLKAEIQSLRADLARQALQGSP